MIVVVPYLQTCCDCTVSWLVPYVLYVCKLAKKIPHGHFIDYWTNITTGKNINSIELRA